MTDPTVRRAAAVIALSLAASVGLTLVRQPWQGRLTAAGWAVVATLITADAAIRALIEYRANHRVVAGLAGVITVLMALLCSAAWSALAEVF